MYFAIAIIWPDYSQYSGIKYIINFYIIDSWDIQNLTT